MKRDVRGYALSKRFVVLVLSGLVVLGVLGSLRFQTARLAYRLDSLDAEIKGYVDEEISLRQELSGLVAPIRIYSYCKEHLGMQKVVKAETLPMRFRNEPFLAKSKTGSRGAWRSRLAWIFGRDS